MGVGGWMEPFVKCRSPSWPQEEVADTSGEKAWISSFRALKSK